MPVAYAAFFVSGLCGLGQQMVWCRKFGIGLGHELPAVLAVVTAFFGGVALGAWILDRLIGRSTRPGRWYGAMEIIIGGWGILLVALLPLANNLALEWIGLNPSAPRHWLAAFVVPFTVLLPATMAMGATLPAMEGFVAPFTKDKKCIGTLYSVNTLGAVSGVLLTTLLAMPALGFNRTLLALATMNILSGAVIFLVESRSSCARTEVSRESTFSGFSSRPLNRVLFFTGLLGIGFEVLGVRVLSEVLENTVFTFAASLSIYLLGTATGAGLYQRFGRGIAFRTAVILLLLGLSTTCLLAGFALAAAQSTYDSCRAAFGDPLPGVIAAEMTVAASVFGLPTVFMGAAFSHLVQSSRGERGGIGRALAINTLGSALAPLLFGVLLLPALGAKWSLVALAIMYLLLLPGQHNPVIGETVAQNFSPAVSPEVVARRANFLGRRDSRRALTPGRPNIPGFSGSLTLPVWLRLDCATLRAPWLALILPLALIALLPHRLQFVQPPPRGKVLEYREGVMESVAVVEHFDGHRSLLVNNRFTMGGTGAADAARRQAHIPLLLHREPKRALFLGLGTGITLAAAGPHPDLTADGVELIPEIPEILHHFEPQNRLRYGLRVHVADARRFIRVTSGRYDVIVADLFHPARDGAGTLYTLEHFRALRSRLAPGGIVCQWLPLHQLDEEMLRVIVRTFLEVFPNSQAFLLRFNVDTPVLGLIAGEEPMVFPPDWLARRVRDQALAKELRSLTLQDELHLFGCYLAGPKALRDYSKGAPLNTDDSPVVMFRAPEFAFRRHETGYGRLLALLDRTRGDAPSVIEPSGSGSAGAFGERLRKFIDARDIYLRGLAAESEGRLAQAIDAYIESARVSESFTTSYARCLTLAMQQARTKPEETRRWLQRLAEAQPDRPVAKELLKRLNDTDPAN